ncbi:hypothetical protein WI94_25525 [Burkholderia vietnamiensis]|nr:hypothetical protein WI94_25525 [Burkholderia vietnamiensis]KVE89633.1 hypothetical protein WJ00_06330 [Burkholderia vietnamiensis]
MWVRLIVFDVGSSLPPVENIVGRIMDKHRAQRRRLLSKGRREFRIDAHCHHFISLGTIHCGIGSWIDDD